MMVNSIAIRCKVDTKTTFRDLFGRTRDALADAFENQEYPFDSLVEKVRPDRSIDLNPLFQAMFSLHDATFGRVEFPGVTARVVECISNGETKLDLNVVVIPHGPTGLA